MAIQHLEQFVLKIAPSPSRVPAGLGLKLLGKVLGARFGQYSTALGTKSRHASRIHVSHVCILIGMRSMKGRGSCHRHKAGPLDQTEGQ